MSRVATLAALVLVVVVVVVDCAGGGHGGEDWPGWRGPRQDGSARGGRLAADSRISLELTWHRPLGSGYSSISVSDGVAVTMDSDSESDRLVAFSAESGNELWHFRIAPTYRREHAEAADGPLGTPTIADGVVYGVGPRGDLFAVDLGNGKPLWTLRLDESLGARAAPFGFATSPVIVDDTLIVPTGAGSGGSTCGLDAATGELRWRHGSDPVGYQSPLVRDGEEPQVAVATDRHVFGLDPATGRELWRFEHIAPVIDGYTQLLPLDGDLLVAYYLSHAAAYRLSRDGAGVTVEEAWRSADLVRNVGAPVRRIDRLYGFLRQQLVCLDASSGERLWVSDDVTGRGLIAVGELLGIWQADGTLLLVAPGLDGVREIAGIATGLDDGYTAPSYARGRFFVRNLQGIAAIDVIVED